MLTFAFGRYTYSNFTIVGDIEFIRKPRSNAVRIKTRREINQGAAGREDAYGYEPPPGVVVEVGAAAEIDGESDGDNDGGLNFETVQLIDSVPQF